MKRKLLTGFLYLILLTGIGFLLYPTISDLWNSYHQTKVIVSYVDQVIEMDEETRLKWLNDAREYNETLVGRTSLTLSDDEKVIYEQQLNMTNDGMMGYVEIPDIDVSIPIYHGTSESVLQVGVGHLEGSSLPVGGESTHTVISGHTGLPSAKILTDLDQLKIGDQFYIHVLGEILTYEVDQILTVEPQDTDELMIQEGKDLCTLVTCTPYGINSHRLLVRGHRIETPKDVLEKAKNEMPKVNNTIFIMIGIIGIIILMILFLVWKKKKRIRGD